MSDTYTRDDVIGIVSDLIETDRHACLVDPDGCGAMTRTAKGAGRHLGADDGAKGKAARIGHRAISRRDGADNVIVRQAAIGARAGLIVDRGSK